MKIKMRRNHTVRPGDYEAVGLLAEIEIDLDSENDKEYYEGKDFKEIGEDLSEAMDHLLDTDVDRTLRLDGDRINDTHLWVFYAKE